MRLNSESHSEGRTATQEDACSSDEMINYAHSNTEDAPLGELGVVFVAQGHFSMEAKDRTADLPIVI